MKNLFIYFSKYVYKILNNKNIRVCIGHSNADMEIGENALDAGATGITHLFCAMAGVILNKF